MESFLRSMGQKLETFFKISIINIMRQAQWQNFGIKIQFFGKIPTYHQDLWGITAIITIYL